MTRYEKYDPISGGFRATLGADLTAGADGGTGMIAVSINTSGLAIKGTGGASGLAGIVVKNAPKQFAGRFATSGQGAVIPTANAWLGLKTGDVVDVMTAGEIVDLQGTWNPGDIVYVHADGTVDNVATAGTKVGFIVGSGYKKRAVIRVGI